MSNMAGKSNDVQLLLLASAAEMWMCVCVWQRFTRRCERSHSGLSPRRQDALGLYATGRNCKLIMNQINTMSEVLMRHDVHSSSADATVKPVWTVCGRQEQLQVQTRFSMKLNSLTSYLRTGAVLAVAGEVYFQTVSSHARRSQINQAWEYRRWSGRQSWWLLYQNKTTSSILSAFVSGYKYGTCSSFWAANQPPAVSRTCITKMHFTSSKHRSR